MVGAAQLWCNLAVGPDLTLKTAEQAGVSTTRDWELSTVDTGMTTKALTRKEAVSVTLQWEPYTSGMRMMQLE